MHKANFKNVFVSVIVTTKNEERNIEKCLKSIRDQTYQNIEIIIVDNNSTDLTMSIARKYTHNIYTLGPERSAQRNYGISMSKGEWILFLDADMILTKNLIQECIQSVASTDIVGLYIPEKIIGTGFWIRVRDFERSFYNGTVVDCVRFVSKDVHKRIGGFDLSLTGPEDWDYDKRVRKEGKVKIIKGKLYHNEGVFNMSNYLKKKKYYSMSFQKYIDKWGKNDPDIIKQLGWGYRLFGVFFEAGKWINLIKHPILSLGMYYLRLRTALTYLKY